MRGLLLMCLAAVCAAGAETAQDSARARDEKIDRIAGQVDELHEVVVRSPLEGKNWGVEINPIYLLFVDKGIGLTAGVSNFSWTRKAEIAFPIIYEKQDDLGGGSALTIDAHYRRFLSGRQRGFYISGFGRYQHANYRSISYCVIDGGCPEEEKTLDRGGVGFGIGYRIFSRMGLYWGTSLSLGRYIVGGKVEDNELPNVPSLWFKDVIFDVELLKIGFAF
jgi:hypothetical protein